MSKKHSDSEYSIREGISAQLADLIAESTNLTQHSAELPVVRHKHKIRRRLKRKRKTLEAKVGSVINLKQHFPPSLMYGMRLTFNWWLLWVAVSAAMIFMVQRPDIFDPASIWMSYSWILYSVFSAVVVFKYLYAELYRSTLEYSLDGFRLHVRRGVFVRNSGSVPLSQFGEVYVRRTVVDVLCGVYEFQLLLSLDPTKSFAKIEGLSKTSAFGLQDFLNEFLSKQLFVPPEEGKIQMHMPGRDS